jgi:hypothetical protein
VRIELPQNPPLKCSLNLISKKIIQKLDFKLVGEQIDDVDGVEEIYELSSSDYKLRFTDISS